MDTNWRKPDVPHLGWRCGSVIDLREQGCEYEDCEMCGREQIRFVHVMVHDDYDGTLRVGCVCAGRMQQNQAAARQDDAEARNRSRRLERFRRQRWSRTPGGASLRYKGVTVEATVTGGVGTLTCLGETVGEYRGAPIDSGDALRAAAFELLERKLRERRDARANGGDSER